MRATLNKIVLLTSVLTLIVIVLGAYTRLKDAGLGCPDWPGCYGHILAPEYDTAAWIEMVHRYVAGTLGILIFYIFRLDIVCMDHHLLYPILFNISHIHDCLLHFNFLLLHLLYTLESDSSSN